KKGPRHSQRATRHAKYLSTERSRRPTMSITGEREVATLGVACCWCLDSIYRQLKGVESVVSGYAGGTRPNPSYREVCGGSTGHAEVVQITFDPSQISYRDLLDVFFTIH